MATPATSDLPVIPIKCSELVPTAGMTRSARVLLTQEARIFLIVDCLIRVQIIVPSAPPVFVAIDETPENIGLNRMPYLSPPLPTDTILFPIRLVSGQIITGATREGTATCGLFIERLSEGS
jgi:hypothetical protein